MADNTGKKSSIDLNTANEDELMRLEGIDGQRAKMIVDHRKKNGPFASWEDFEAVLGIGPALVAKAKAEATLGGGAQAGGAQVEGVEVPKMPADEVVEEMDEEEALATIVRLDLEAALAYDLCAQLAAAVPEIQKQLESFRDDHFRHVDDLNGVLRKRGAKPIEARGDSFLLPAIARLTAPFGLGAAIVALVTNEQLTNEVYDLANAVIWEDDVRKIIERNAADEERHLNWLSDRMDEIDALEEEEKEQLEALQPEAPQS